MSPYIDELSHSYPQLNLSLCLRLTTDTDVVADVVLHIELYIDHAAADGVVAAAAAA